MVAKTAKEKMAILVRKGGELGTWGQKKPGFYSLSILYDAAEKQACRRRATHSTAPLLSSAGRRLVRACRPLRGHRRAAAARRARQRHSHAPERKSGGKGSPSQPQVAHCCREWRALGLSSPPPRVQRSAGYMALNGRKYPEAYVLLLRFTKFYDMARLAPSISPKQ